MRLSNPGQGLYRSRRGVVMGVCRGLAQYFDLSVTWVRVFTVLAFVFTGFWPVGVIYLVLALVMKPEPMLPPADEMEQEFYHSYAGSRPMAISRLSRTYQNLERRLRRLEDVVTSPDFRWQSRARGDRG